MNFLGQQFTEKAFQQFIVLLFTGKQSQYFIDILIRLTVDFNCEIQVQVIAAIKLQYQFANIRKKQKMDCQEISLNFDSYSSDDEVNFEDFKKSSRRTSCTLDSPMLKPRSIASQTLTQDSQEQVFENKCQKYFENGFCPQGKNCLYQHQTKNLEQIIGTKRTMKRLIICDQFPQLMMIRNSRNTSFFF